MNYLDLKTNKQSSNKKRNREDFQFHRYYHLKRKSCMKRPRRWQTVILGSCFTTNLSMMIKWITAIHLCSSSRRYYRTRSLINISMKLWWSFPAKFSRMPSIRPIYPNWRKKSTVSLDLMPLTFHRESSSKSQGKRSSLNWWMPHLKKLMLKWSRDWSSVFVSQSTYFNL